MRKNNKNKGFTLVELLIVVAIIGILAAVLTPQFLNARKAAADKAAKAYGHNVYTAVQAYIAEHGSIKFGTGDEDIKADCANGFTAGEYSVSESPNINECTISPGGSVITITPAGGTTNAEFTIGHLVEEDEEEQP